MKTHQRVSSSFFQHQRNCINITTYIFLWKMKGHHASIMGWFPQLCIPMPCLFNSSYVPTVEGREIHLVVYFLSNIQSLMKIAMHIPLFLLLFFPSSIFVIYVFIFILFYLKISIIAIIYKYVHVHNCKVQTSK